MPDRAVYSLGVTDTTLGGAVMAIETDPVCGMQVDTETTDPKLEHDGTTYWFCGRGCLLDFRDDPEKYLDPDYQPSM
jgi:Cu+-exporting ATPase